MKWANKLRIRGHALEIVVWLDFFVEIILSHTLYCNIIRVPSCTQPLYCILSLFSLRHALPLFTSLLNTVCGYDPAGILPYNHLLFNDSREELVEAALQVRYHYLKTTCKIHELILMLPEHEQMDTHTTCCDSLTPETIINHFSCQVLIITLDQEAAPMNPGSDGDDPSSSSASGGGSTFPDNLFLNYLSRIHRYNTTLFT